MIKNTVAEYYVIKIGEYYVHRDLFSPKIDLVGSPSNAFSSHDLESSIFKDCAEKTGGKIVKIKVIEELEDEN